MLVHSGLALAAAFMLFQFRDKWLHVLNGVELPIISNNKNIKCEFYVPVYPKNKLTFARYASNRMVKNLTKNIVGEGDDSFSLVKDRRPLVWRESAVANELVKIWKENVRPNINLLFGIVYSTKGKNAIIKKPVDYYYPVAGPNVIKEEFLKPILGAEIEMHTDMTLDEFILRYNMSAQGFVDESLLYSGNYRVLEGLYSNLNKDNGLSAPWRRLYIREPFATKVNITVDSTPPTIHITSAYVASSCSKDVTLGLSRVTAIQSHYSEFHRMIVQLQGVSTYIISSPAYHSEMHSFPAQHPFSAYSQVNYDIHIFMFFG